MAAASRFSTTSFRQSRISPFAKIAQHVDGQANQQQQPASGFEFPRFYGDNLDTDKLNIRADAALGSKDNLSVRWTRGARKAIVEGGVFGAPVSVDAGVGTGRSETEVHNVSITETHTFSPTLINELLIGVQRSRSWPGHAG